MAKRGKRISPEAKRADLVLVDARLSQDGQRITVARGYERWGDVWSDLLILDRDALIRRLKDGRRIFTGRLKDLPGDFDLLARVSLGDGGGSIRAGSRARSESADDLGIPLF